ncbi:pseudouridine synthase [Lentinula aff. detonsa]|uniref:Pseudouridine synthase n=1 Tax=Lentinula aff. detonsa TaxID=2804958 RepID=A0AA38TZW0_9AGAR|nr:pseudouridine synthase [Lentinula aff. detonsa]
MLSSSSTVRERENDDDDLERNLKRPKIDASASEAEAENNNNTPEPSTEKPHVLPPSHSLLGVPLPTAQEGHAINFLETNVGISEYVGRGVSKIEGIIKQRFTDFLVNEVDLDGNVIHLKSLGMPEPSKKYPTEIPPSSDLANEVQSNEVVPADEVTTTTLDTADSVKKSNEPWPESFNAELASYLSETAIAQLKEMFLQGPEPPRIPDSGWGGRTGKASGAEEPSSSTAEVPPSELESNDRGKRGRGRGRDRGGGRGGRGGGRGGDPRREDHRKVVSEPIDSKETRTAFHQVIRKLFDGKLDSETDTSAPATEEGSRIVVKWSRRGVGRGGRERRDGGGGSERAPRGTFPPYIHFTFQKTNRDTQDALSHLSRMLKVNVKDLSVAGTKDKRGVTVQRVSLKRNNKSVEDVWNLANGVTNGRKTPEEAVQERGERGVRIADLNYRKTSLELGLLKGNAFVITLRSVQVDSMETLDKALNIVKNTGFINYYGMQRFGTASVPTHAIGLALLQSDWQKAASLILQPRHGEHPDVEAARNAWLVEHDLDKALSLMPRRVVAERCLLESYKKQKGDTRNAMGALSTIPRNLRLMYVHAYQSYVWNAIVSERVRMHGAEKPVVGDLVFEVDPEAKTEGDEAPVEDENEDATDKGLSNRARKKLSRKPWSPPQVKTLTEEVLDKYTMLDVIMPLPGTDVAYPGGQLGDRYREFLKMDGLDPDNFVRKQKDYTLSGSYRKILHRPTAMTWSVMHYTDPDVPLAQADEDKLLGFDPPVVDEQGKFMALQINLTLGTASYATMALREITKTETSSHYQSSLTNAAEDQKYRGMADADVDMDQGVAIVGDGDEDAAMGTV